MAVINSKDSCRIGTENVTPFPIENRPGLESLSYRIGTHGSFLATMKASLSDISLEDDAGNMIRLKDGLRTREVDDFSIASLDSWSMIGDVLTFYQERIANEGFLRTAKERRSVLELSRLVGYTIKPGISASTDLAFSLDKGFSLNIEKGMKVQSLPQPGEQAQIFETMDDLKASWKFNEIIPRQTRPVFLTWGTVLSRLPFVLYFKGVDTKLTVGQALLFACGDGEGQQIIRFIRSVEILRKEGLTKVVLRELETDSAPSFCLGKIKTVSEEKKIVRERRILMDRSLRNLSINDVQKKGEPRRRGLSDLAARIGSFSDPSQSEKMQNSSIPHPLEEIRVYAMRIKATLFGSAAPMVITIAPGTGAVSVDEQTLDLAETDGVIWLDNSYEIAQKSWIVIQCLKTIDDLGNTVVSPKLATYISRVKKVDPSISIARYRMSGKTTRIEVDYFKITQIVKVADPKKRFSTIRNSTIYAQSEDLTGILAEEPLINDISGNSIELDGYYDGLDAGRTMILSGQVQEGDEAGGLYRAEKIILAGINHGLRALELGDPFPEIKVKKTDKVYTISVVNKNKYSKDLFDDLQGLQPSEDILISSRTWIDVLQIKDTVENSDHKIEVKNIKSFTNNKSFLEEDILKLNEGELFDGKAEGFLYIIMRDRRDDIAYISNLISLSELSAGTTTDLDDLPPPFIESVESKDEKGPLAKKDQYFLQIKLRNAGSYLKRFPEKGKNVKFAVFDETLSEKYKGEIGIEKLADLTITVNSLPELVYVKFEGFIDSNAVAGSNPLTFGKFSNLAPVDPQILLPGDSPHTALQFTKPLSHVYLRGTVRIYGNIVLATHGETRKEILGSGDASLPLQEMRLRQFPLTYLSSPIPSGAESTLVVRVDGLKWHETDSPVGLKPDDRKYIIRNDDAGKTKLIFGNGLEGSRPPTGIENVTAVYRTGLGKSGNVGPKRITLLVTRPLGVKGVTNPLSATGGADSESLDQAKCNAPLAVMALDRLVSVRDYEDFARNFAGIGKASAVRLSDGSRTLVHISVAGSDDIPIDKDSELFNNLYLALKDNGDPHQPIMLDICEKVLLLIRAGIKIHPDYQWSLVEKEIRSALLYAFGFDKRELGQGVAPSEVITVIQRVKGVDYVDLDILDSISQSQTFDPEELSNKIKGLMGSDISARDVGREEPSNLVQAKMAEIQRVHVIGKSEAAMQIDALKAFIASMYQMAVKDLEKLNPEFSNEEGTEVMIWPRLNPAQVVFLSQDIPDAVVLKEVG